MYTEQTEIPSGFSTKICAGQQASGMIRKTVATFHCECQKREMGLLCFLFSELSLKVNKKH
jgi:hypothetical protein